MSSGKHLAKAEEMQNEVINLPDKAEDMHLLLLRYREDLIVEKTAKEHLQEKLHSQVIQQRKRSGWLDVTV